jgi:sigma-B regulation protein RsbU (phosphoserine phosphatase)
MELVTRIFGRAQTGFLKPPAAFVILLAALTLYQYRYQSINNLLDVPWIPGIAILFHMCVIVILISLFNILYYMYIKDQQRSILIYASGFAVGIVTYLMVLLLDLGGPGLLVEPLDVTSSLFSGGRLILYLAVLAAEIRMKSKRIKFGKRRLEILLPLLPALVCLFLIIGLYTMFGSTPGIKEVSDIAALAFDYFAAITLLLLMMLAFRRAYVDDDYRYLGVVVGYICLFFSKAFAIIAFDYEIGAQMMSIVLSLTGFALLLNQFFRTGIGDPLSDIAIRENQITLYANNLERVLQKRMNDIFERNRKFTLELEYARNIQQSLLPEKRFAIKNTSFISGYFPCEDLSGDFYDIYRIDDDNVGMYILDVSGHGISAALMTMFCNNYIKSTERLIKRYRGLKPHKNLSNFYEEFNRMNFPDEMHMVIFFASYCLSTRTLTYCTGGMNCIPFIISREGTFKMLDDSLGFPICKFSDLYKPVYQSATIELQPGDRVVFYTDGLIDLFKNRVMDQVGLEEFMTDHIEMSLKTLNEHLVGRIYPKVDKLKDDISYFIMEVLS